MAKLRDIVSAEAASPFFEATVRKRPQIASGQASISSNPVPFTARILQLADVYDALTTERPDKPALSASKAQQIMQDELKKGWWDPCLFAEFRKMLRRRSQKQERRDPTKRSRRPTIQKAR